MIKITYVYDCHVIVDITKAHLYVIVTLLDGSDEMNINEENNLQFYSAWPGS